MYPLSASIVVPFINPANGSSEDIKLATSDGSVSVLSIESLFTSSSNLGLVFVVDISALICPSLIANVENSPSASTAKALVKLSIDPFEL